ncbi:transposase [Duganella sp. sic0402]|uniref:transposase n=1 Tax=Duganella sp. sic0402 TaxID=2854786 RepID=UPI001C4592E2|nr:transposase [Duganella sp. sic0402]MBV7534629.1 transposase [Duganella sp. sic0402]
MSRPLRLEFAGAVYHVTARGDRRRAIYRDDTDRYAWLEILGHVCARFNFTVHSFCQMGNHYHLLLETQEPNLSQGMRQLNGQYSQYFNRRHQLVGHVFQGRYTGILVQKERHLCELSRYVVLNPIRAKVVPKLDQWPWSSYAMMIQAKPPPHWLQTSWLLISTAYTMKQIAAYFHISDRTVSRIVQRIERLQQSPCTFGRTDPG